jgi:pilus assembly protein CpaF
MVMMAGYDLPLRAIRQQVAAALDLIIHLERVHDGSRKVMAITEVQRMESDVITLQELYRFHVDAVASDRAVVGQLASTGLRPGFLEKFDKRGVKLPSWLSAAAAVGQIPHAPSREAVA